MRWNRITMPDGSQHVRIFDDDSNAELIQDGTGDRPILRAYVGDMPLDVDQNPQGAALTLIEHGASKLFVEEFADAVHDHFDGTVTIDVDSAFRCVLRSFELRLEAQEADR